jgi:hypothetical protein
MQFFELWARWSCHFSLDLATDNLEITGSGSKVEYQLAPRQQRRWPWKCPQGQVPLAFMFLYLEFISAKLRKLIARIQTRIYYRSHGTSFVMYSAGAGFSSPPQSSSHGRYSLSHTILPRRIAETALGESPLLGLCHFSLTIAATSVIFLLTTIMLTLFSNTNVWKVSFLTSRQRGSVAVLCMFQLQCAIAMSKQTRLKLHSSCNAFQEFTVRQTDHATDILSESPPICNYPWNVWRTDSPTSITILSFCDF